MKIRHHSTTLILFICVLSIGILLASSVDCQYTTGTTLPPLSLVVGYGGLFNPYVFWPSSSINAAAASAPLVPFFPPTFGGFGLGSLFGGISQLSNSFFNPALGFGSLGLGVSNPFSVLPLSGLNSFNPLSLATLSGLGSGLAASFGVVSPARTAAQTGTWTGTWTSTYLAFPVLFHTGPMMLNIVEDPLLGAVVGTTILQGSRYASALTEVAGVIVNNVITLEGFLLTGYDIGLTCYLITPTMIKGFYTVYGTHTPIIDEGVFSLTLNPVVL